MNIKVTQFRSSFDGTLITFIDYNPTATAHEKRKALAQIRALNAEEYIKEHRPKVYEELLKAR